MTVTVVVGAQWGDEGKGKIVDLLAERAELVVRFQGGNNAGHTLVIAGEKTVLHHIPSGILRPDTKCVLAPGVVVDPRICLEEIHKLQERGYLSDPSQLTIGAECSVIMPYHRSLDVAREAAVHGTRIGTTGRGIGPCYEDRIGRRAVVARDLLEPETLRTKVADVLVEKNAILARLGAETFDADVIVEEFVAYGEALRQYIRPTGPLMNQALRGDAEILMEGAQGTLLDVGLGTYPFVTSSHTVAASACVGAGIGPRYIQRVVGVTKAYCTRVGEGPFPTELHGVAGEDLRQRGDEYGATTGRPRRCGWLDVAALAYAVRVNGLTELAVTKLDVLSGLDKIRVAVGYRDPADGTEYEEPPADWRVLDRIEPIYEDFEGWTESVDDVRDFQSLPSAARAYLEFVERRIGIPIAIISVGPARSATFEQ